MIVGLGSLSWLIVRDLAARLPVMVLPRWLNSRTQPVAIDDVVIALVRALDLPLDGERVVRHSRTGDAFRRADPRGDRARMGLEHPRMLEVPLLSPRLSSLWVRFVTRAQWSVAREVVVGLTEDLLAHDDRFWQLIGHPHRLAFAEAAGLALDAERRQRPVQGPGASSSGPGLPSAPNTLRSQRPWRSGGAEVVRARYGPREREDPIADAVVAARHPPQLPLEAVERLAKGDEVEAVLADAAVGHGPAEDVGGGMEALLRGALDVRRGGSVRQLDVGLGIASDRGGAFGGGQATMAPIMPSCGHEFRNSVGGQVRGILFASFCPP